MSHPHDQGAGEVYGSASVHQPAGHTAAAAAAEPMAPVPVKHHGPVPTQARGADYGGWMTYQVTVAGQAQPILPYDPNRARAVIIVSGAGPVFVGTQAQTQASPPVGGQLGAGSYETKNKQALWLVSDGAHTATVTVLNERWAD